MSKGLTLIEAVIGIAIISFGVVFLISVFPLGIRLMDASQRSNTALFLASSKIEEAFSLPHSDIGTGIFTEDFGSISGFENYKREMEVSCFDPEGGSCVGDETGIKEITVTVSFKMLMERSVSLSSLITER